MNNKQLYTASGQFIQNNCRENFNQVSSAQFKSNNTSQNIVVNDNKCLKFCGEVGKYLCMKPFTHSHDENINGTIVKIQYKPNCGHCVSRPDVYYVEQNVFNLIANSTPFNINL